MAKHSHFTMRHHEHTRGISLHTVTIYQHWIGMADRDYCIKVSYDPTYGHPGDDGERSARATFEPSAETHDLAKQLNAWLNEPTP